MYGFKTKFNDLPLLIELQHHYSKGSNDRQALQVALQKGQKTLEVPTVIAGIEDKRNMNRSQSNPADHDHVVAKYSVATRSDVSRAIDSALAAKPAWESMPFEDR